MADNLGLFYLIEGSKELLYISVSNNSKGRPVEVDDLRKTIFKDDCKGNDLAANYKNLTILKVRILLAIVPFLLSD